MVRKVKRKAVIPVPYLFINDGRWFRLIDL